MAGKGPVKFDSNQFGPVLDHLWALSESTILIETVHLENSSRTVTTSKVMLIEYNLIRYQTAAKWSKAEPN